jgi:hypothetical protein
VKRLFGFLLVALSAVCLAQTPQIKSGSTVYIEPMDGYETYLAAAFAKKKVPLVVVDDETKADFLIKSTMRHIAPSQPAVVVNNSNTNVVGSGNSTGHDTPARIVERGFDEAHARQAARGSTSASISLVDARSSQIVFAYAVGKSANTNQIQSTAEACAKHLKESIEKSEKQQR